ncbi:MAG: CDP-alcohol phosphatidyltransferase family protein [Parcubacteria group bacterium]|nr:CDP-alcohol phosphatidyltransferase family protein [Parcubacteria group bacterium]
MRKKKKTRILRDPYKLYWHDKILKCTIIPLIPGFLRPNHFTGFRLATIPIVLYLILTENYAIGIPFFFLSALTDMIDGTLARVRGQITDWGILWDPIADKLLIGSVVIILVARNLNLYLGLIIVALEIVFVVGGLYLKRQGKPIVPTIYTKTKMLLQVIAVALLLISLPLEAGFLMPFVNGIFSVSIVLAILSLILSGLTL